MPKTPDEIKKAMLHCSPVSCRSNDCPYKDDTPKYEGDMPVCRMKLWHDMVCLIRQLEAERDAAVACLKKAANEKGECFGCKWYNGKNCTHPDYKMLCSSHDDKWEWRGVQKEE